MIPLPRHSQHYLQVARLMEGRFIGQLANHMIHMALVIIGVNLAFFVTCLSKARIQYIRRKKMDRVITRLLLVFFVCGNSSVCGNS
jgi:hypothetical protein